LNFEFFYSNLKFGISIMKIVILTFKKNYKNLKPDIWIWKLLFQLFKTLFEFENFELNMIFSISIQKDLFDLKIDFEV
jgi:hypothetical protein